MALMALFPVRPPLEPEMICMILAEPFVIGIHLLLLALRPPRRGSQSFPVHGF